MGQRYKIVISYRTGDSFGSQDATDDIPLLWENLDVVKRNLQRIKEHHQMYEKLHSYTLRGPGSHSDIKRGYRHKDWFVPHKGQFDAEHNLFLEKDDGTLERVYAFWHGYFEDLYSAEIQYADSGDNEMKVSFRGY